MVRMGADRGRGLSHAPTFFFRRERAQFIKAAAKKTKYYVKGATNENGEKKIELVKKKRPSLEFDALFSLIRNEKLD